MTPPSYPAIFIPEIQQSICQHLARRDQVQVARLSTAFTDVALNAIYKELTSLVGIFKILGEMKTPRNPDHTTGLFKDSIVPKYKKVITRQCWERFSYYACRVLKLVWSDRIESYNYEFVGRLLSSKPESVSFLFPQLRELQISICRPLYLGFASAILSPSISTIIISRSISIQMSDGYAPSVAELPERCPGIRSLQYTEPDVRSGQHSPEDYRSSRFPFALLAGWNDLEEINLCEMELTVNHLEVLSGLPRLWRLRCVPLVTKAVANSASTTLKEGFPRLTSVDLRMADYETAISFLKAICHTRLNKLCLYIDAKRLSTGQEATALASYISKFYDTLHELTLYCGSLFYEDLHPLGRCRQLKILLAPIRCNSSDIDNLSLKFPNLQQLDIRPTQYTIPSDEADELELDLTCLKLLARRCPNICRLALELDPNAVLPGNWHSKRFPRLEELKIEYSDVEDPFALATFLSSISLTALRVSGLRDDDDDEAVDSWGEVDRLVPLLQSIRKDERRCIEE